MRPEMRNAQARLTSLLGQHELTKGLYVKVRGHNLTIGRHETDPHDGEPVDDDRIRLTHLGRAGFGLSVKRHTGRWEKTPFCGTMEEMVAAILATMQHIVAVW